MRVRPRTSSPRSARPDEPGPLDDAPLWVIAAVSSAGAAVTSAIVVLTPMLIAWLASPGSSASGGQALEVALDAWLLAHGARLHVGGATVSMTPWLLTLVVYLALRFSARRVVASLPRESRPDLVPGGVRRDVAVTGGAFVGAYALCAALVSTLARSDVLRAGFPSSVSGAVVLSGLAFALALRGAPGGRHPVPEILEAWVQRVPAWLRRALRPAVVGVVALLVCGAVATLVLVAVSISRVSTLYSDVGGGVLGGVIVTLTQATYLPTAAVWAVSFAAGPGFSLGAGSSVTWTQAQPGLLPLVPVFGALPDPGPLPPWLLASVAVPVVVGVVVGWRCVRACPPHSSWRERARTVAAGVALTAAATGVAGALASGSLGSGRFTHVGVNPWFLTLAVFGELALGASVALLVSVVRLRRVREEASPASD